MPKLLRVNYGDPSTDWEAVPRSAPRLRVLHLESSEGMNDASLIDILDGGNMTELEVRREDASENGSPDIRIYSQAALLNNRE